MRSRRSMCGIALIISGASIDCSSLSPDFPSLNQPLQVQHPILSVDDFKAALHRRGPDYFGSKKLVLPFNFKTEKSNEPLPINVEEAVELTNDCIASPNEVAQDDGFTVVNPAAELHFMGATLHLRGTSPVYQPLVDDSGNILVYNGELFGGLHVESDGNDTEALMHALGRCCSCRSGHKKGCSQQSYVPELLSTIKGPWALIYWQDSSKTLWFGRDAFGRRSLLVHWPTLDDCQLLLSSVSPPSSVEKYSDSDVEDRMIDLDFWAELSCGIYSIEFNASKHNNGCLAGAVRKHEWTNPLLKDLIKWDRAHVEPSSHEIYSHSFSVEREQHLMHQTYANGAPSELGIVRPSVSQPAHKVLIALRDSVMHRSILKPIFKMATSKTVDETLVPVAVLFSGGLDSMILAALLTKCLEPCYEIDLLNVSFDGQSAPDRISARAGLKELQRITPSRRWNLVEIDADLSNLTSETKHVVSLINPSKTYMDLNIGIALWLAAGGDGWVDEDNFIDHEQGYRRSKYKSKAKILLVGSGADEQCAGYGRHKTKYRLGGWAGLHEEMKLDMQRIWKRNLGRDDRCISDSGKEARFPFLDEDVIRTLLEIPLWEVVDLNQPSGRGDKKILREEAVEFYENLCHDDTPFVDPEPEVTKNFLTEEQQRKLIREFTDEEIKIVVFNEKEDSNPGIDDDGFNVAQLLGIEAGAFLPKRAIQFGSRIARESNRKNFGSNRAANQASAGSLAFHKS
ncbi:hypothetical protein GIB67_009568 [Kingdonia uniflora]|uniref:Glutamine amidotransferase type-2 domain-containing protein n=1 Tax=Kingdonia uniflora TaxID=39325 RepID=A0A7J7NW53_9MAGN|nr:hypothetical protein GIB67_009568 [Kingdonia uniflora]